MTRILSLDDDPKIVELIQLILTRAGYESLTTTNAQEAFALLRSQPIDLFTQDILRPGIPGAEFLHQMKSDENLRQIPVVIISAVPYPSVKQALQERGLDIERDLDGFLTEPFGRRQLLDTIEAVLPKYGKALPPAGRRTQARENGLRQPNQTLPPTPLPCAHSAQSNIVHFLQKRWAGRETGGQMICARRWARGT